MHKVPVAPDRGVLRGVDVSYYQGEIDWARAKTYGLAFAFIRTSDSTRFPDPNFEANWRNAKMAGVRVGPYIYFRPEQSAIGQAEYMMTRVRKAGGLDPGDLPPVLDLEQTDGLPRRTVLRKAKAFVEYIEQIENRQCIVYGSPYFLAPYADALWRCPLWIADYRKGPPSIPSAWSTWSFWQQTDKGNFPGIGRVDENVFNGSFADLARFCESTCIPPGKSSLIRRLHLRVQHRFFRI